MTSSEIYTFLGQQGAKACDNIQLDGTYAHATRDWLLYDFSLALLRDLEAIGLPTYLANAWDCDKWAFFAHTIAHICHARTSPNSGQGLAFGIWMYTKADNSGGHAINFAITYEDGKPHLIFYEPQTQSEVKLFPAELIGATYII